MPTENICSVCFEESNDLKRCCECTEEVCLKCRVKEGKEIYCKECHYLCNYL